jgi:hypothetical protein
VTIDDLIGVAKQTLTVLDEASERLDEFDANNPTAQACRRARGALRRAIDHALAAPEPDGSGDNTSYLDRILHEVRHPAFFPSKVTSLWALSMLRRVRSIVRHLLAAAEITEPAETIAATQKWLDDLESGPPKSIRDHRR